MSDRDDETGAGQPGNHRVRRCGRIVVEMCGRFVEQDRGCFAERGPSQGQPRPLPRGEPEAVAAELTVQTAGQRGQVGLEPDFEQGRPQRGVCPLYTPRCV